MAKSFFLIAVLFFCLKTVEAQDWLTNFDEAKKEASATNRNILLVFQGSDWCAPCIKLDREVWRTDEFKSFAKDHYIMLKADFPRKKVNQLDEAQQQHNNKLAEAYNIHGYFPFVVILDNNGKILGETGYKNMAPHDYISLLTSFEK